MNDVEAEPYDLFVIGGGINGAGIARDAAGRGYRVALAEMNDFGSATSSSSTKLFHGGLRYLEFLEIRLVREALIEREILLNAMPHISWPMRFVLPVFKEMRFESDTPISRFLAFVMPWAKGKRPKWLIRLGLFLYDNLGGRKILPGTSSIDLRSSPEGAPLKEKYKHAYEYSDCWVEDARLTLLNIKDAALHGADIQPHQKVIHAEPKDGIWHVITEDYSGNKTTFKSRMIVNATGPWIGELIHQTLNLKTNENVRLVRGSHIVTKKLFGHDKSYFFQGTDGRIMFAIPYEEDFTLIGTTDAPHSNFDEIPKCSDGETDYMLNFINAYFRKAVTKKDIVWTYSGVRPLYDDGANSATAATRDYILRVNKSAGPPVLNIFGGKITTYRKLAESALDEIDDVFAKSTTPWTASAALPGGDMALSEVPNLTKKLDEQLSFLDPFTIRRLVRQYGTQCLNIFEGVAQQKELGRDFGCGVFGKEIDWAIKNEWVTCAEDFLWRRSKMGLRLSKSQKEKLDAYIKKQHAVS